jgi:hypothetical protein
MITVKDIAKMREDERTCDVITFKDFVNMSNGNRTSDEIKRLKEDDSIFVTFSEPFIMVLAWTHANSIISEKVKKIYGTETKFIKFGCSDNNHIIVGAANGEFDISDKIFVDVVMQKIANCAGKRGIDLTEPLHGLWERYVVAFLEHSKESFGGDQMGYGG